MHGYPYFMTRYSARCVRIKIKRERLEYVRVDTHDMFCECKPSPLNSFVAIVNEIKQNYNFPTLTVLVNFDDLSWIFITLFLSVKLVLNMSLEM